MRREHVEALKVGGEGRRQERRPCVGVDRILDGVARPGKSRAALGQLLGGEAVERGDCGIPKKLEALVRGNRGDVAGISSSLVPARPGFPKKDPKKEGRTRRILF